MKEHCVAKNLLAIWGNNSNFNSYRFRYNLAFNLFLSNRMSQKEELYFYEVVGLVKENISALHL